MKKSAKIITTTFTALVAPIAWGLGSANILATYLGFISDRGMDVSNHPMMFWIPNFIVSFAFGFLFGLLIVLIGRREITKYAVLFLVVWFVGQYVIIELYFQTKFNISALLESPGTWAYFIGFFVVWLLGIRYTKTS